LIVSGNFSAILESLPSFERAAEEIKEILLTNLIMIGEVAAQTFEEEERVRLVRNRFTECGLQNCSSDEKGNGLGILPGKAGEQYIVVVAHVDTVFGTEVDHTLDLRPDTVVGPGLGDNSLGVAVLATLPTLLDKLDIGLKSHLLLMAATRSLGRGDLEGLRFFLANNKLPISAGVCLEGARLGRLSHRSVGMIRGEVTCSVPEAYDWTQFGASSAILTLNRLISKIAEIPRPNRPRTSVVMGSIQGGSSFSTMATNASLRFEVLSDSLEQLNFVWAHVENIVAEVSAETGEEIVLNVFARRDPGEISFSHPLVTCTRSIHDALSIQSRIDPSTSELSAFIDRDIPAITLGLAEAKRLNKIDEELAISSMFTGLAQLVGVLLSVDGGFCDER